MKVRNFSCAVLAVAFAAGMSWSQASQIAGAVPSGGPVVLDWTPPALAQLNSEAALKSNFTLDRAMLGVAAGMMPDADAPTRQAINKVDGVSVHLLRFGAAGVPDEAAVASIRDAYHLRGWKHVVSKSDVGGALHDAMTDVWVVMDGANVRGAVVLAKTARASRPASRESSRYPAEMAPEYGGKAGSAGC